MAKAKPTLAFRADLRSELKRCGLIAAQIERLEQALPHIAAHHAEHGAVAAGCPQAHEQNQRAAGQGP